MTLEICADSIDSAIEAAAGGAGRIELCSALGDGGVTPSAGLMKEARRIDGLALHVLIRPRGGDFVYSPRETDAMIADIKTAMELGADGIVIGALLPDGDIDTATCRRLIEAAAGCRNITFHRAFDLCRDPFEALEKIIALGCNRLLTSGQAPSAEQGIETLRELNRRAAGRITVMPGGGISPRNAARIMRLTGCTELHGSLRAPVASAMTWRRDNVAMGTPGADEYSRLVTSRRLVAETVEQMREAINNLTKL